MDEAALGAYEIGRLAIFKHWRLRAAISAPRSRKRRCPQTRQASFYSGISTVPSTKSSISVIEPPFTTIHESGN